MCGSGPVREKNQGSDPMGPARLLVLFACVVAARKERKEALEAGAGVLGAASAVAGYLARSGLEGKIEDIEAQLQELQVFRDEIFNRVSRAEVALADSASRGGVGTGGLYPSVDAAPDPRAHSSKQNADIPFGTALPILPHGQPVHTTAAGWMAPHTHIYTAGIFSDDKCTQPIINDVGHWSGRNVNPFLNGKVRHWLMARPVPSSSEHQCSLDVTLATAVPPVPTASFMLKCDDEAGTYRFVSFDGFACEGEPLQEIEVDKATGDLFVTGGCFKVFLPGLGPPNTYMKYDAPLVGSPFSTQELCPGVK